MKILYQNQNQYFLRFDKGEEALAELKKFCEKNNIGGGFFTALGATDDCALSYYDLEAKNYQDHRVIGQHEIINLTGNIAKCEEKIIVHAHAVLGDKNLQTISGHVKNITISVTLELILNTFTKTINRKHYPKKNLFLLN